VVGGLGERFLKCVLGAGIVAGMDILMRAQLSAVDSWAWRQWFLGCRADVERERM
jgi:hypothetical protein